MKDLIAAISNAEHTKAAYVSAFKEAMAKRQLKMPALAMPVRYALFATTQTPAIDSVLAAFPRSSELEFARLYENRIKSWIVLSVLWVSSRIAGG